MSTTYMSINSPCGPVLIGATELGICQIEFNSAVIPQNKVSTSPCAARHAERCAEQLTAYFAGNLQQFDLELAAAGTPFQQEVWVALTRIPYAETCSYGELARDIGKPTASRAVGAANGQNPLAVVVPCHRVIGSNGNLTGYAGGLDIKRQLLDLEAGQMIL